MRHSLLLSIGWCLRVGGWLRWPPPLSWTPCWTSTPHPPSGSLLQIIYKRDSSSKYLHSRQVYTHSSITADKNHNLTFSASKGKISQDFFWKTASMIHDSNFLKLQLCTAPAAGLAPPSLLTTPSLPASPHGAPKSWSFSPSVYCTVIHWARGENRVQLYPTTRFIPPPKKKYSITLLIPVYLYIILTPSSCQSH